MESFLSRYKNVLVLVCVLVLQIAGLAVQIRRPDPSAPDGPSVRLIRRWAVDLIVPPEKAIHGTGSGIDGIWSNYLDLRHVREQNDALRAQVGRLELEQGALLEDARQGQRLQQLLGFREHYIYATIPAQVVGTSGTDQSQVLYINKGSKDGLKPDMPVITPDGIVGKLKDVFSHTAQVLEISDQTSGAGVLLETTRLRGVLRGNAFGQPQIINLLPDERVKPGEHVITSGGDGIFPRGLAVGVVDHVVDDPQNPPYVDVIIKPAANLGRLGEVLIITQLADQMPAQEKTDLAQSADAAKAAGPLRAADVLAERLPGLDQPPPTASDAASPDGVPPAVKAPLPLHADRYTPDATPPAADLTPGRTFAPDNPPSLTGKNAPLSPDTSGTAPAPAANPRHTAPAKKAPPPAKPPARPPASAATPPP
jgi:rod shape-determining protein MreC